MHPWFKHQKKIKVGDLKVKMAQDFANYVYRYGEGVAQIEGALQREECGEILLLNIKTGIPQNPAYNINRNEKIGIFFSQDGDSYPIILSTREDFPDTPHQNIMPQDVPYSICIDDRPWDVAKITFTSAELLYRIILWFEKAGKGELHSVNQPLDPYFCHTAGKIILPRTVFEKENNEFGFLVVSGIETDNNIYQLDIVEKLSPSEYHNFGATIFFVVYDLVPQQMSRLRYAPDNLYRLHAEMKMRGVDLINELKIIFNRLCNEEIEKHFFYNSKLGIILRMPIKNPTANDIGANSIMSFITSCPFGDVGCALGKLTNTTKMGLQINDQGKYISLLVESPLEISDIESIKIFPLETFVYFDPILASKVSGLEKVDSRKIVQVGVGSIGSLVLDILAREGRYSWSIIDDDILLPHNLVRHALAGKYVGQKKACALKRHLSETIRGLHITDLDENIVRPQNIEKMNRVLEESEVIFDASASVVVSRYLCDIPVSARRVSFFYNSGGSAAILMIEDEDRKIDLRSIEASLYSHVLTDRKLTFLFIEVSGSIPYSGMCSSLTNQMSAADAHILSALVAKELGCALLSPCPLLKIWHIKNNSDIETINYHPELPHIYKVNDWKVRLLPSLEKNLFEIRRKNLPNETGGILLGIVDIPAKQLEIVGILPPPPDSIMAKNGFIRGCVGLNKMVKDSMNLVADLIRYVGEWHSHPDQCTLNPSSIDEDELTKLSEILSMDGYPGVQIIVGENNINIRVKMHENNH